MSVLQLVMLIYIYIFDLHIFDLGYSGMLSLNKATDGQRGRTNYYHNNFMKLICESIRKKPHTLIHMATPNIYIHGKHMGHENNVCALAMQFSG